MELQSNLTEETLETRLPPTVDAESVSAPAETPVVELSSAERLEREILLRSLRKKRRFLRLGQSLFATEGVTPEKSSKLLQLLQTPNPRLWKERVLAAETLGCLPLEGEDKGTALQTLGAILTNTQNSVGRRLTGRLIGSYGIAYMTALLLAVAFLVCLFASDTPLGVAVRREQVDLLALVLSALFGVGMSSFFLALPIYPLVFGIYTATAVGRQNRVRAAAATALGRIGGPESVSVVAQALCDKSGIVDQAARQALPYLLPQLTPDHYGLLDSALTPNLCHAVRQEARKGGPASAELALALLEALEKVGDGRAVEPIRALIASPYLFRLRQEAERILPRLEARRQQENDSRILLRGATLPESQPEELLRAATNSVDGKPEQLLRIPTEQAKDNESGSD